MDRGAIRSLKVSFRRELVYKTIEKTDNKDETKVGVLDAILLISKARDSVKKETIANCFRVSGLTEDTRPGHSREDSADTDLRDAVSLLTSDRSVDDYVQVDDEIITCEQLSDPDIPVSRRTIEEEPDEDVSQESEVFGKFPTVAQAYAACSTVRAFFHTAETSHNVNEAFAVISTTIEKEFIGNVRGRRKIRFFH